MSIFSSSLSGIDHEIRTRKIALRHRKSWYLRPTKSDIGYSIKGFYFEGHRIMKEIQKLQRIKRDMLYVRENFLIVYPYDPVLKRDTITYNQSCKF